MLQRTKFRELLSFLTYRAPPLEKKGRVYTSCVRSSMTYGRKTRPLLADVGLKFERADMQMIRWMCGVSLKDRRMDMAELEIDKEDVHDRKK